MTTMSVYGRDPEPAAIFTGLELWSLVGGSDALADASDSTYVQAGQHWTGSGATLTVTGPHTGVTLDEPPIDLMAGDVWDHMVIHVRFQQQVNTRAGVGPPYFQWGFSNPALGFIAGPDPSSVMLMDDFGVHDYLYDWTPDDNGFGFGWPAGLFGNGPVTWTIAQGAELLAGPGSGDTQHRIYQAWMEVGWIPGTQPLMNAERSSPIRVKNPDGSWADIQLVGS